MKKLVILAAMVAMVAMAGSAFAQAEPGDIGIFFDAAGTVPQQSGILPGAAFPVYIVGFDLDGDVFGYEFAVTNPVGPFILSRTTNPATALDVGPGDDNWIVGTGVCVAGAGPVVLLTESVLLFAPQDNLVFCLGPANPSTTDLGGKPGWLKCDETLQAFGVATTDQNGILPDGCAVGNDTGGSNIVGVDATSFGSMKAQFND